MKIRKISVLALGCIFALVMILNQLVGFAVSYILKLFPSLMSSLGGNVILTNIAVFVIILIMGLLLGALVALAYNLIAKSKKFQLVLETDKK